MGTVSTYGKNKIEVKAISLDEIVEKYGEIELLKMDIEGAEHEIGKSKFYGPSMVLKAIKNSEKIKGQTFYKISNYIYLLTPLPKPITLMFSSKERVSLFSAYRV